MATSITAGIPKIINEKIAAIEPASAHPHCFLFMAYMPPTKLTAVMIMEIIAKPMIMPGTNSGISPTPPGTVQISLRIAQPINRLITQKKKEFQK